MAKMIRTAANNLLLNILLDLTVSRKKAKRKATIIKRNVLTLSTVVISIINDRILSDEFTLKPSYYFPDNRQYIPFLKGTKLKEATPFMKQPLL